MKCRVCRGPAVIDIRRHNANFCQEHFLRYCRTQVEKTLKEFSMVKPGDRVLVAVSGGKDSLAVWDILLHLGYEATGLYVGLGLGEYYDVSGRHARRFAEERGLELIEVDIRGTYDIDVPTAASVTGRAPCSACGLSKRHVFDQATLAGDFDALVTGHNLDDEAAVLFGNVLHWQSDYLGRQQPVLPAGHGFPKKVKPLVRLGERETAAYCVLAGIDYLVEECPMAKGNKHLHYKAALNLIESESPGSKQAFYFGFLRNAVDLFSEQRTYSEPEEQRERTEPDDDVGMLRACEECGATTNSELCAFCRLVRSTAGTKPVPIAMTRKRN